MGHFLGWLSYDIKWWCEHCGDEYDPEDAHEHKHCGEEENEDEEN